jgi:hypothetical protein
MFVYLVEVSKEKKNNRILKIPSEEGLPLCPLVWDQVKDQYSVSGLSFVKIGCVPISYRVEMEGVGGWGEEIPLPMSVLRRYMDARQKKVVDNFKAKAAPDSRVVSYQVLSVF